MTTRNILSGFQHTGIFPFNRELFTYADVAPSTLTDKDIPDVIPMQLMADVPNELEANTSTASIEVPQVDRFGSPETLPPGTSNAYAPYTRRIDAESAGPSTSAAGTCVAQSSYHTSDQAAGPLKWYTSPQVKSIACQRHVQGRPNVREIKKDQDPYFHSCPKGN